MLNYIEKLPFKVDLLYKTSEQGVTLENLEISSGLLADFPMLQLIQRGEIAQR